MVAIPFDTLRFAEKLEAGGFTAQQARTAAEAFADATSQELASKGDIAPLRSDMALLGSDMEKMELRLRTEIASTKNEILRWTIPLFLAQAGLLAGILLRLH